MFFFLVVLISAIKLIANPYKYDSFKEDYDPILHQPLPSERPAPENVSKHKGLTKLFLD